MSIDRTVVTPDLWMSIPAAPAPFGRVLRGVAIAVLLPFLAWWVDRTGVVQPNLKLVGASATYDTASQTGSVTYFIKNEGQLPVTVRRVDNGVDTNDTQAPVRIAAGQQTEFVQAVSRANDQTCSGDVTIHYATWHGRHAITDRSSGVNICDFVLTTETHAPT
jgi:hypothetical protein